MSEPISMGIGLALWEYAVKPIVDSVKKEYGESVKEKLKDAIKTPLSKLPFKKNELEVIEAEIIDNEDCLLLDKDSFLEFINSNQNISQIIESINQREPNINIEKAFNDIKIDGDNNSISF
jgi:hypothetical protein